MPKVTCDIISCCYNEKNRCYAGHILISEKGLTDKTDTCCGSYLNKEAYSNLVEYTNWEYPTDDIKCKVGNCRYYEDNKCTLDNVHISGKSPTHIYIETYCSSFQDR